MSMRTILGMTAAAALAAMPTLFSPDRGLAQVAAKVESQTRPNFGLLLDPPTRGNRSRHSHSRRWSYRDHSWGRDHGWRPDFRPGSDEEVVLVDCGGNPGTGAVEDAVRRVRPGGTLVIRAKGGPCVGWLNIDKPMTIIGEGGFDRRDWERAPNPSLQAPDGLPCMTVAPGVRVEVRDIVFASPRAGEAACIVGYNAEILMNRVGLRHAGDEPAIFADGGLLDIRNGVIDARTIAPAIVADGATLTGFELTVLGAQSGVEITPGAAAPSSLSAVKLLGPEQPNSFGPRAIGVTVRASRDYGRVTISDTNICGYVEGVAVEGASVSITNSRICKADKGAVLYNGELTLTDSRVRAETVGVAAASGRVVVTDNVFARVRDVIYAEPRASVEARNNRVWSRGDICRPRFEHRYRDRYAPYWGDGGGWSCQDYAYPRDWWDEEEGGYGLPYYDDGYALDGYDRFREGYGWYDSSGRYVQDSRYVGDARWGRGRGRGW